MNELALFAGAGGGILGGRLLGWRTVCAVELDSYARNVLLTRQADGCLDRFPIWDDVRTFDGTRWRGTVDIISGGFPCQDISAAGKGAGITGAKSGLWSHMARIIGEVRPRFVFVENSPLLVSRGLALVLGDLAAMGYDARWGVLGAEHAGAPHKRHRLWIMAYSFSQRHQNRLPLGTEAPRSTHGDRNQDTPWPVGGMQATTTSLVDGDADGMANRMDRLRCLGNGQVPAVVRLAWETLTNGIGEGR